MDRGAWWAVAHNITKSQTQLQWPSMYTKKIRYLSGLTQRFLVSEDMRVWAHWNITLTCTLDIKGQYLFFLILNFLEYTVGSGYSGLLAATSFVYWYSRQHFSFTYYFSSEITIFYRMSSLFFYFSVFRCIYHTNVFHPNLSIFNLEKIKDTLKWSEFTHKAISPTPTCLPSNCYVELFVPLLV